MSDDESAPDAPPPRSRSVTGRAAHGALWSTASYGAGQVLRLGSNLILTRLLFEEAFGVMALVNVFIIGLHLFSDIGINASVIQNEKGDQPDFLDTAWTLQILRGLGLFTVASACALPFAAFYDEPQLAGLIPIAASSALFDGFISTKRYEAQRNVQMKALAIQEIVSQTTGIVVMVLLAYIYRSVWALALGGVVQAAMSVAMSHFYLPGHSNRLRWHPESVRGVMSIGRWVFLSTSATFFSSYTDRLLLGKLIPTDLLGVYNIGLSMAGLPRVLVAKLAQTILFPVMSRVFHDERGELKEAFHRTRLPILIFSGWCLAGFIAGGQVIIDLLYDDRYIEAGWVVQVISIATWFTTLELAAEFFLLAQGRPQVNVVASYAHLAAMLVLIPLGHDVGGFFGAVVGYGSTELVRYLVFAIALQRAQLARFWMDGAMTLALLASALVVHLVERQAFEADWGLLPRVLVVFFLTTGLWSPGLVWMTRRFRRGRSA